MEYWHVCLHVWAWHTSHWPRRPLSCSLDQMLWTLPACSGCRLLSPQVHWCFCICESYTRPAHTHPHLYSDFSSLILHVPAREADLTCCEAKLWVRQGQRRHCSGWMRSKRQGGGGWGGLSADKRLMRPNQGRHAWMVQWSQEPLWFREQIWSAFSSKITRQIISILFYIN